MKVKIPSCMFSFIAGTRKHGRNIHEEDDWSYSVKEWTGNASDAANDDGSGGSKSKLPSELRSVVIKNANRYWTKAM